MGIKADPGYVFERLLELEKRVEELEIKVAEMGEPPLVRVVGREKVKSKGPS